MAYCLAIDIGASSGRHILGDYQNGEIFMTEVYRFENGFSSVGENLVWDVEHLNQSILAGLKECKKIGKIPQTVAIDTWGVDYVLLDEDGKKLFPAVSYRDERTVGVPEKVDAIISMEELYQRTGIQRQNYNTIYQLYCDKESGKLDQAQHLLMMPEYLSYCLTGVMKSEYTIASTTSLLNLKTGRWDEELLDCLGIPKKIFHEIAMPGTVVGNFTEDVKREVGFDATVVFAPAHDTASAVTGCRQLTNTMFISSGTWSLVGTEIPKPIVTPEAKEANFANAGGVTGNYRLLKDIMGMWLFQSIRKNLNKQYSYDEMMEMAKASSFTGTFYPNDQRLVAPDNMIQAIRDCLGLPDLPLEDVLNSTYHSLANSYAKVLKEIERITGKTIDTINIVGGGSQDTYLNHLTEVYTNKPVIAGPVEATALGNLKTQILRQKEELYC